MNVCVTIPAYNAAATLQRTVEALPREQVSTIIVVDNASTDNTLQIAESLSGVIVIKHERNRGYGGSQKSAYTEALKRGADIVVMVHGDFQYDPTMVPQMMAPIANGTADMVMGSRFLNGDPRASGMPGWRYIANRFLTTMQNVFLGTHLSEGHSGYRAYSRKLLQDVPFMKFSDDFVFDAQMITAVSRRGYTITEVPIPVRYSRDSSSISLSSSIRYGCSTLWALVKRY